MKKTLFALKQLLNFKFTLPLAKLDIAHSRSESNGLVFSNNIPVDIQQ